MNNSHFSVSFFFLFEKKVKLQLPFKTEFDRKTSKENQRNSISSFEVATWGKKKALKM